MADPVPRFDRRFDPRWGEAVEIVPDVRRITARNPGIFTFHGTNGFLVGSGDEVVVIDPGPDDPTHVAALLAAIGPARLAAVLLTHSHRDHVGATAALRRATGAPVASGAAAATVDGVDRILADGDRIVAAGVVLEAIATPGHASDHFAFALPEAGLIFTGDHVMAWSTTVVAPPDGSMTDYMASLARIAARPERRLLPAHGPGLGEATSADHLAALAAHRRRRERALLDRLAAVGAARVTDLVEALYADVDRSLHGAAAQSLLAHLEDLVGRGLVAGDGPLAPDTVWRLG
jgi:glyoxylase-like metal-dependent hydrolase (beta-lactamase superfamily II)